MNLGGYNFTFLNTYIKNKRVFVLGIVIYENRGVNAIRTLSHAVDRW